MKTGRLGQRSSGLIRVRGTRRSVVFRDRGFHRGNSQNCRHTLAEVRLGFPGAAFERGEKVDERLTQGRRQR